jgi:hypothetical protein
MIQQKAIVFESDTSLKSFKKAIWSENGRGSMEATFKGIKEVTQLRE